MSQVYSTQLFHGQLGAGVNPIFLVPPGVRCIVRDIQVVTLDGGGGQVVFSLMSTGFPFAYLKTAADTATNYGSDQWQGRVVVDTGDEIEAVGTGALALIYVTVSGYLLTLP